MAAAHRPPMLGSLALIAIVIGLVAAIFAYTAGWFSPQRLTPDKLRAFRRWKSSRSRFWI